jgi:hypothetical protein
MTALTVSRTAPAPRMTRWLVRLHRPALVVWAVALVLVGGTLAWLWGPLTDAAAAAWRQYNACEASTCLYDQDAIIRYKDLYTYATFAVLAVPFLVAAWAGAALTGRELEQHTAELAWTQGVSPTRWLLAKLALPATLVTAGTGLLVLLHHQMWWAGESVIDNTKSWYDPPTFYAGGPITVALALAGLFAGALAGLLLRRSLAALGTAMVATAVLWAGVQWVLPHLWSPVTVVGSLRDQDPPGGGIAVSTDLLTASGEHVGGTYCGRSGYPGECSDLYDRLGAVSWSRDYHPLSHYWPLQLTASAIVLAVAVLLALAAFRVTTARTRSTS